MFFLLPIRTSIRPWRTPYANYALIFANVVIFLLTYSWHTSSVTGAAEVLRPWMQQFMLTPVRPFIWQFVTYAFLHQGLMHIIGNMFFLYLFGNNVNDKLGSVSYLCFYLTGAVFSGIGHTLMSSAPVLGASGAVAAVTGAYLVLFPGSLITVFWWIVFFMDTIEIPAWYFVCFKLIFWDNIAERRIPNIAYGAHLSGYTFGILAILIMIALGLIKSTGSDLWAMIKQWNRRRLYRDIVSTGYEPFASRHSKWINVKEVKSAAQTEFEEKVSRIRSDIADQITQHNLPAAAQLYLELVKLDDEHVLPRHHLLDIANQLAGENKSAESAHAYEQFLAHYSSYEYVQQVELMLGILYSRYLGKPDLAMKYLLSAEKKLNDPNQLKMCRDELDKLRNINNFPKK